MPCFSAQRIRASICAHQQIFANDRLRKDRILWALKKLCRPHQLGKGDAQVDGLQGPRKGFPKLTQRRRRQRLQGRCLHRRQHAPRALALQALGFRLGLTAGIRVSGIM